MQATNETTQYAIYASTPGISHLIIGRDLTFTEASHRLHQIEATEYANGKRVRWLADRDTLAVLNDEGPYHGMVETTYNVAEMR